MIKDIFFEKPHSAHIEILFDMSFAQLKAEYTIYNFETLHKAWSEVLDTQILNKRFYAELSNWYFWAIKTVVYPGAADNANKNCIFVSSDRLIEHNAKNLIRLLTRLLFVWFIKEKELIPEELFDENTIKDIITLFEPEKCYLFNTDESVESKSIYYKAILQNLFFASLNAEQGKRAFRIDGQNQNATSLMRYKRYHKNPEDFVKLIESKVPFMNGGLFECLDHQDDVLKGKNGGALINYEDGFSDRKDNELFVPDYIFFGKDVKVDLSSEYDDKKKKDVTVNGIINILQKYKFTIAENTPVEEDIALDPELLGRVFENLLASYNPETKTNARKQTGSFYTPRPIVEYMVDESLKAYLKTKIASATLSNHNDEDRSLSAVEGNKIDKKLDNLIAYNESEPEFTQEERFQILRFIDECRILDPACGSGAFPMGILQKMVYVIHKLDPQNDNWKQIQIQKISNDTMLTPKEKNELQKELLTVFDDNELDYARKLYLIENCIHGIDIQPIATQISRLRFFISLIVDQKVDDNKANFGVRPLPNLENRFVTANSLIGLNEDTKTLFDKNIELLMERLQKVRHKLFNAKSPKYKFELRQEDKVIRTELEAELVKNGFGKENAKLLSTWDPYDKNKSAEFFDAEWMFGIKDGFDIVIGNPPYIRVQNLNYDVIDKLKSTYETALKRIDISLCFIELAAKLLNAKGLACFISSNQFMTTEYGKAMREFLLQKLFIKKNIDLADLPVFESAMTYVSIFQFTKITQKVMEYYPVSSMESVKNMDYGTPNIILYDSLSTDNWNLKNYKKNDIFKKMQNGTVPLDSIGHCNAGLITGCDKVLMFNEKSLSDLPFEKEILLPVLRADNCSKYQSSQPTKYVIYPYYEKDGKTCIYSEAELKDKFPKAYKYLKNNEVILSERKDSRTTFAEKGNWYGLVRFGRKEMFNQPKIISPGEVQDHKFCLDYSKAGFSCARVFAITIDNKNFDIKYILGILNTELMKAFIQSIASLKSGGYYQYSSNILNRCPIPEVTAEQQKPIIALVDKILVAKKADNAADTSAMEAEIDDLVYALYGLTEEEIKIVEGK